jgi:hypothetical protein
LCFIKHNAKNMYGEVEVQPYAFLTSVVDGVSDQVHATVVSAPGKEPRYPFDIS